MNELEKQNALISSEANKILHDCGLLKILKKYGNPVPTGSYVLGLMTWRDLDIYLESDEMTADEFFQLGAEIVIRLKPHRMQYLNEFLVKRPNLPLGYYWGIVVVGLVSSEDWNIDLWAINSEQLRIFQKSVDELKTSLTEASRLTILEIKSHYHKHPQYRRGFGSVDIYQAVIKEDVESVKEFARWLAEKKGIS
jgi:hypothetical protein